MQLGYEINSKLYLLLQKINDNEIYQRFLKKITEKIKFNTKNILNLTTQKVQILYKNLQFKISTFKLTQNMNHHIQNALWLQNQLRIFIYILLAYIFCNKKSILEMKEDDYMYLHNIFPTKLPEHLQYQVKLLFSLKNNKWTFQESRLFNELMIQNQQTKRWNFIAKQMFIRSNKKSFKTPKQCRQRWLNHVDPKKLKGSWDKKQDIILLSSIQNLGKKWTLISKQLKQTRSQNSVKNRFNSLIKSFKKNHGIEFSQKQIISKLIESLKAQDDNKDNISLNQQMQKSKKSSNKNIQLNQEKNIQSKMEDEQQQNQKQMMKSQIQFYEKMKDSIYFDQGNKQTTHNLDMQYMCQLEEDIQNIVWYNSSLIQKENQQYFVSQGSFCFLEGLQSL